MAPPPDAPTLFRLIARQYWQLSPYDTTVLWAAIWRSRWSRAHELRQYLALVGGKVATSQGRIMLDTTQLLQRVLLPPAVMTLLEELYRERRLSRAQASHLQTCILQSVSKEGGWK
jgi:hypothetical protein